MTSTIQLRLFPQAYGSGTVYAILMPSHAVKFGWTRRPIRERVDELHGELLTCMPGSLSDEKMIHAQLAPWRIGRSEDFWPAPAVWSVVEQLRERACA